MSGKTLGIALIVIVLAGGLIWYLASGPATSSPSATATTTENTPATGTSINPQSQNVTITYTDSGFSPKSVTIPEGATVTWINQSASALWVGSDPHPAHTGYDGTSRGEHCAAGYSGAAPFDSCKPLASGASWSFTFDKVGTWGYHNHSNDGMTGTVVVTAQTEGGPGVHATTSASVNL